MSSTLIEEYSQLNLNEIMLDTSFSREEKWMLFQKRIEILKNRNDIYRDELNNPMTNQTACWLGLKFAQLLYNTFGWRGPSLPTIGASMSNSLECMNFVRSTGSEYGNQYPIELDYAFRKNNIDMILFLIDDGAMLFDTSGFISLFIRYNIHDIRIGLHLLQKNVFVGLDVLEYLNNLTEYDLYDNNIRNILFNQDLTRYVSIYNIINNLKERRKITYEIILEYMHKDVVKYILNLYI